jgi:hypothetical protein
MQASWPLGSSWFVRGLGRLDEGARDPKAGVSDGQLGTVVEWGQATRPAAAVPSARSLDRREL